MPFKQRTNSGRVVYRRPLHDFKWVDALRVVEHGLGMPPYVDKYIAGLAGLPLYKMDTSPSAAREYVCMMLILDTVSEIVANMPRGSAHETVLTTAYYYLSPKDRKKYARVLAIQLDRLGAVLMEAASTIGTTEGL